MLDRLAMHYDVHAIDWLGTGLSSRGKWTCKDRTEAEAYFTSFIERYCDAVDLKSCTVVGHSFGGYAAAVHAITSRPLMMGTIARC